MIILEFQTETAAQTCLQAIDAIAAVYWKSLGFTVVHNHETGKEELIGRNLKTGEDEPSQTRTLTWGVVKESPDGTFYLPSLTGTKFQEGMEQIPAAMFGFTERPFPEEWYPKEEEQE